MTSGERVRQAREIRGLTQTNLASLVKVHQSNIARIEQGILQPSPEVLHSISLHTDFPLSFFGKVSGPEFADGTLLFRKRASLRSADRARIRQLAKLNFELYEELAKKFRVYEIRVPRFLDRPKFAAKLARASLGFSPDTPIDNLLHRLEKSGVVVLSLPLEIEDHDAFSLWSDGEPRRPVLVMSSGGSGDRQRFNLAHELGHLVLHQSPDKPVAEMEREANDFAAEFLMPAEEIAGEFPSPLTLSGLLALKRRWGVSVQALAKRAKDLTIISERQYKYLLQKINFQGWRKAEPQFIPLEKPRLFRKMVEKVFGHQNSYSVMAKQFDVPETLLNQLIDNYAAAAGEIIVPPRTQVVPFRIK